MADDTIVDVEPNTLINLCRKHNAHILSLLEFQKQKGDMIELIHATRQIQLLLSRCVTDYGDLKNLDTKAVENVYVSLCKYERKILRLAKQGIFAKIMTQSRLRSKIDQLSNSICVQVETLENEIKKNLLKEIAIDNTDDIFNTFLKQIADEKMVNEDSSSCSAWIKQKQNLSSEKKIKDKDTKEKVDNALSIVRDPAKRVELLHSIPNLPVKLVKQSTSEELINIMSSSDESERIFGDLIYAKSISSYPLLHPRDPEKTEREGDPICDMYHVLCSENSNRTLIAMADGCGWGYEARDAARKSTRMFIAYMKAYALGGHQGHIPEHFKDSADEDKEVNAITNTHEAASLILRAYRASHKAIVHGRDEDNLFHAGTTTMLAGIIMELDQKDPATGKGYVFVFGSVGDCKAYIYSAQSGTM